MRIVIETMPYDQMRYPTAGDYWTDPDGTRHIVVAALGDEQMEAAVALHELVELFTTEANGISEADILQFDMTHPELADPGRDERAPYHHEHVFAECLERLFAERMGVNWDEYGEVVDAL